MAVIENFLNIKPPSRGYSFDEPLDTGEQTGIAGQIGSGILKASDKLLGFGAGIIGGTAKTFARPFGELVNATSELTGHEAPRITRGIGLVSPEILAAMRGGSAQQMRNNVTNLRNRGYEGAGFTDVLNVASLMPGGIFAKAAEATTAARLGSKAGFARNLAQSFLKSAPEGAAWGAAYGLAGGLDQRQSASDIIGSTLKGAALGVGISGAASLLGSSLGAIASSKSEGAVTRASVAIGKRENELNSLIRSNNKLSSIVENAKKNGYNIPRTLAEVDTLVGSVSKDGRISTRGEGEALSKVYAALDKVDSTILDNVEREGSTVFVDNVEKALKQKVENSGLVFSKKEDALALVEKEIDAMRRQSTDGKVPLADVQKAKIQIKPNYLDPEKDTLNKMVRNAYKDFVEKNISSIDVQQANKELGELYAIRDFVDALHGKTVKGGRLDKYFAKTLGAVIGSHFGPFGSIVGSEVAGAVQERMLESKFGKATGKELSAGEYLTKAAQKGKSPRLALPAPSGTSMGSRVIEPGVISLRDQSAKATIEPGAKIIGSTPIEQPRQGAVEYQGEGGFQGEPIPMGAPTTYEPKARVVGGLTLEDITPPKVSEEVQNALATLKTAEEFDAEVSKRIEKLSNELPEEMKPHAEGILYETNPDVRALIDARDNANVIDVTPRSVSYIDEQIAKTEKDIKAITEQSISKKDIRTILKDSGFSQWEDTRRGRAGTGGSLGDFSVKEEGKKDYIGKRRTAIRKTGRTIVVPISEKAKRDLQKSLEKSGIKFTIAKGNDAIDAMARDLGVYEYFVIEK